MAPGGPSFREHGHGNGAATLQYMERGEETMLLSTGQDGRIKVWSLSGELIRQTDEIDCDGPMHSVAVRPDGEVIAAGNETSVNLFKADDSMEFIHTAATFQFSVRSVKFSPDGDRLVAAGDDPTMSIVNVDETSESTVAHSTSIGPNTRGLAWDPAGTYIAVVQTNGCLQIWDASTQTQVWKESLAPSVQVEAPAGLNVAWSPNEGRYLATPSNKRTGDVTLWKRLHWGRTGTCMTLTGVHTDITSCIAFSPNGHYLATAAADKQLAVWDVSGSEPEVVIKHALPAAACSVAWHPTSNELSATLVNNNLLSWQAVVPAHLVEPQVKAPEPSAMPDTDDLTAPLPDIDAAADGNAAPGLEDADVDLDEHPLHVDAVLPSRFGHAMGATYTGTHPQPPFQPGSCPPSEDGHYLLQYSLVGHIVRKPLEDAAARPGDTLDASKSCVIDTVYHDVAKHRKRMAPIRPQRDFTMAAVADNGVALASKISKEAAACVKFEPYAAMSARGAWERLLGPVEEPLSLALGSSFVAVATDTHAVHVFSTGGVHMEEMAIGGPVVALAAHGPLLAIVWHRSTPTIAGDQCLDILVVNVDDRRALARGPLPLSPKSTLTWVAFAQDTFTPVSMDSAGILRGWTPSFGGCWSRIFHADDDHPGVGVWPAGVSGGELHLVECEPGECPEASAILTTVAKPLTGPKLQAPEAPLEENEAPLAALRCRLACLSHGAAVASTAAVADSISDATTAARTAMEKTLLKLFDAAVRADKGDRALQLAQLCNTERGMNFAAKIARNQRKGQLAERIEAICEWRFAEPPVVSAGYAGEDAEMEEAEPGLPPPDADGPRNPDACAPSAPSPVPLGNATNNGRTIVDNDAAARKRPALSKNPFSRKAAKM